MEVADDKEVGVAIEPLQGRGKLREDLQLTLDVPLLRAYVSIGGTRSHDTDWRQLEWHEPAVR